MRRLWRGLGVLAVILLFATAAGAALPRFAFQLLPAHTDRRSAAVLDKALDRAVDASLGRAAIDSVEAAMDFSLSASDRLLRFGLHHPQSLTFSAAEREGNCVEYAHLFARVFDKAAQRAGLDARAYVVHSARAELFGRKVPLPGWEDHDWVLIQTGPGDEARRLYVDPTMHDAGLGWDVSANVRGAVKLPSEPPVKASSPAPAAARASERSPRR
jgi:hypothetical protein